MDFLEFSENLKTIGFYSQFARPGAAMYMASIYVPIIYHIYTDADRREYLFT